MQGSNTWEEGTVSVPCGVSAVCAQTRLVSKSKLSLLRSCIKAQVGLNCCLCCFLVSVRDRTGSRMECWNVLLRAL